jgi:hypothetical protein
VYGLRLVFKVLCAQLLILVGSISATVDFRTCNEAQRMMEANKRQPRNIRGHPLYLGYVGEPDDRGDKLHFATFPPVQDLKEIKRAFSAFGNDVQAIWQSELCSPFVRCYLATFDRSI